MTSTSSDSSSSSGASISSASFRDPSGFVYFRGDDVYRQVNRSFQDDFDLLHTSGLYAALKKEGLIVDHHEVDLNLAASVDAYKVIKPEHVEVWSYPYEWCFSQLKDAALATLRIQRLALSHGMRLKDASAYNIQFHQGRPVLIDTLSLEKAAPGEPWPAYKQFCQHFLAPLALASQVDIRLMQMSRLYIDGIPLDLASKLMPSTSWLSPSLAIHLHLHAKAQNKFSGDNGATAIRKKSPQVSQTGVEGIIDNLESIVGKMTWQPAGTEWGAYYEDTNYSDTSLDAKGKIIEGLLKKVQPAPNITWDLGGNTGLFSRIAAKVSGTVVSADIDPAAVVENYRQTKAEKHRSLLPLVLDLTNPSPDLGWANAERSSFFSRGPVDLVMALALIHHLAISNNAPLPMLSKFFAGISRRLIIEFVPKEDSQVERLLATRKDVFPTYNKQGFEAAFKRDFDILETVEIPGTVRTLYLLKSKVSGG